MIGCYQIEYDDVSAEFPNLIGSRYRTIDQLNMHGVTNDRNYEQIIDVYYLAKPSGFGGREVFTNDPLPMGTVLRIQRIEVKGLINKSYKFVFEALTDSHCEAKPIRYNSIDYDDPANFLDPNLFERVEE